jgi:hypothetical protein
MVCDGILAGSGKLHLRGLRGIRGAGIEIRSLLGPECDDIASHKGERVIYRSKSYDQHRRSCRWMKRNT